MNLFEIVKYGVSCREAAEQYGVEVNHYSMALCPFHNDWHPSLYVADDESKVYQPERNFNVPTYVLCFATMGGAAGAFVVLPSSWTQAICTLGCTHQFSMICHGHHHCAAGPAGVHQRNGA